MMTDFERKLPSTRRGYYTEARIGNVPCVKCGRPSARQWRICSTSQYTAVCVDCDMMLNRMVATWAFGQDIARQLVRDYYHGEDQQDQAPQGGNAGRKKGGRPRHQGDAQVGDVDRPAVATARPQKAVK